MRKIFSILVVLGLVLSMVVMSTPVAAKVTAGSPPVLVNPTCENVLATYTLNFTITGSLDPGSNYIFVEFPAGTVVPTTGWTTAGRIQVSVNGGAFVNVLVGEIFPAGQIVSFMVPIFMPNTSQVLVRFNSTATFGIRNPAPGRYRINVWTDRPADATPVALPTAPALGYLIVPTTSTYKLAVDFGATYPGIAPGFIPPFKACGQNDTDEQFDTWEFEAGKWASNFTLTFSNTSFGCAAPCANATVWFEMPKTLAGSNTTIWVNGVQRSLVPGTKTAMTDAFGDLIPYSMPNVDPLAAGTSVTYNLSLHFSTVGDYEICFYVQCPAAPTCPECSLEPVMIAELCMPFEVLQWKDAAFITVDTKWNLISLPIVPFDTSIESVLAPLPFKYNLLSVWHYDRCANSWATYGNGQTSLTDIADGKAYWFRMRYGAELSATLSGGFPAANNRLWIFGLKAPKAPSSPSAYAVCPGWNMVGFRSTVAELQSDYLWSVVGDYNAGALYGWTAGATQDWFVVGVGGNLVPGLGYWIPFTAAGEIYP